MSLSELLELGDRELISLVGGGGKSTLLFALGDELAAAGKRVLLTTTTKMGRNQTDGGPTLCRSLDCVTAALDENSPVMLVTGGDEHKVTGPPPEALDELFASADIDYIIVEADGSRGRPLKAPASYEPVVPAGSTTVVILMGIDAVGRPLAEAAHRVTQAQRFTALEADHVMTAEDCVDVLLHPEGALRECPTQARVVVAVTKVRTRKDRVTAQQICAAVTDRQPGVLAVSIASSA